MFQAKNTPVIIRSKSKRSHRQCLQPKDRTLNCNLSKNSDIVDNFLNPLISKLKLIYTNDNIQSCLSSLFLKYLIYNLKFNSPTLTESIESRVRFQQSAYQHTDHRYTTRCKNVQNGTSQPPKQQSGIQKGQR